jgi:hypothetical protein
MEQVNADVFVSLDYPPLISDTALVRRKKIFKSHRNFKYLTDRFPNKLIMPVVHGRTLSEIELSIALLHRSTADLRWIGLGGIVPLLKNRHITHEMYKLGAETFIATALTMMSLGVMKTLSRRPQNPTRRSDGI